MFLIIVAGIGSAASQVATSDEEIWSAFLAWARVTQENLTLKTYAEKLGRDGLAEAERQRHIEIIRKILTDHPEEGIELTYDRIFSRPLTGDAAKDGFTSTPSVFMVESLKSVTPGRAVDVGAGQGRNAVWLARHGWDVTAIDISGAGLAAARASAEKAGCTITTVKTTYEAFDFGSGKWDLILMILSWAPVSDPAFVARLNRSLRPGGVVVFEHVIDKPDAPFQKAVHALQPNELRTCFRDFLIEQYEEAERPGDWGGPPTLLVRMVARKK